MPKLQDKTVERNQLHIEAAALRVFTRQGYHGTSVRDIADAAGISIGNLYNYYRTKQHLFRSVVEHYETKMEILREKALGPIRDPFSPGELKCMAKVIREIVYDNPDYWRLMYIDVTEFGNRHFAHTFRSLAKGLKQRMGDRLEQSVRRGPWRGLDPALAFAAIYLQLFTYFLVEKLFGGKQHLGKPDEQAIAQLIRMSTEGVWREIPSPNSGRGRRKP
jgi:AcrR family transcriptional regulator